MKHHASFIFFALCICLVTPLSNQIDAHGSWDVPENDATRFKFAIGNSTYELTNLAENWYMSRNYCKWTGMELVSIGSEEESQAIDKILEGFNERFWIGLNDVADEGNFFWDSDGKLAGPFFNWGINEPDGEGLDGLNCVCLRYQEMTSVWADQFCSDKYRAVCESVSC